MITTIQYNNCLFTFHKCKSLADNTSSYHLTIKAGGITANAELLKINEGFTLMNIDFVRPATVVAMSMFSTALMPIEAKELWGEIVEAYHKEAQAESSKPERRAA